MSTKTLYHNPYTCNKCGEKNEVIGKDYIENIPCEYETTCIVCGFVDYWVKGVFESSQEGYDNCKKYTKDNCPL
jgi:hypothetical protein